MPASFARKTLPAPAVRPHGSNLFRAAALASAVHIWLLFGISWDMPLPSAGGAPELSVEIAPASAPSARRNAADADPAKASAANDPVAADPPENTPEPASPPESARGDATPTENARMEPIRNAAPRVRPSNTVPASATQPPGERTAVRGEQSRHAAGQDAASRPDTDGAPSDGETTQSAAYGASADHNPPVLSSPLPRYPEQARRRGREGTVHVEADVNERGLPTAVRVRRSSGYGLLDAAAVEAVGKWRFRPARAGGKAVPGRVVVPIEFRLKKL
jgi:protein TonB